MTDYIVTDSPFKADLDRCFGELVATSRKLRNRDDVTAMENALYLAVTKRMRRRAYPGDPVAYLTGLLSDIHDAEYEFDQMCCQSAYTDDVFFNIRRAVTSLLSSVQSA